VGVTDKPFAQYFRWRGVNNGSEISPTSLGAWYAKLVLRPSIPSKSFAHPKQIVGPGKLAVGFMTHIFGQFTA
jgi:hypothetical protein